MKKAVIVIIGLAIVIIGFIMASNAGTHLAGG